jgi:hypothetical protein
MGKWSVLNIKIHELVLLFYPAVSVKARRCWPNVLTLWRVRSGGIQLSSIITSLRRSYGILSPFPTNPIPKYHPMSISISCGIIPVYKMPLVINTAGSLSVCRHVVQAPFSPAIYPQTIATDLITHFIGSRFFFVLVLFRRSGVASPPPTSLPVDRIHTFFPFTLLSAFPHNSVLFYGSRTKCLWCYSFSNSSVPSLPCYCSWW